MRPRIIYRTHYQVDQPAYMELLIKRCTSPVQATYTERVSERLAHEISSRGRKFNIAAAAYAVDLARGLGIVNENNSWTDKGHLLALNAKVGDEGIDAELTLDPVERLTHFRLFFEGDGAAILHVARIVVGGNKIPRNHDWNSFARAMFNDIFGAYLTMTADTGDRITIRKELDRLKAPFRGKTGAHKSYVHLETMFRLGLLRRADVAPQREYEIAEDAAEGVKALLRLVPSVATLEKFVEDGSWSEVAAAVFRLRSDAEIRPDELLHIVAQIYHRVSETGAPLCSLTTLIDALQIHLMTSGYRLVARQEIVDALKGLQKKRPRDIRFHVDRRGRFAFVKMSDGLMQRL